MGLCRPRRAPYLWRSFNGKALPMAVLKWVQDHIDLYKTDPEKALYWDSAMGGGKGMLKTLLLTTKGRKSGKDVPAPLIFDEVKGNYIVIASKGGAYDDPDWYKNMQANPDAEVQAGRVHAHVRMRVAEGAEREELWKHMAKLYPPYDDYATKTNGRVIPVVVLEPVKN